MITAAESKRAMVAIHRAITTVWPEKFVFVGGGIVPLLITDIAAAPSRPTKDIDVVFEIASAATYSATRMNLLHAGFTDDATRPKPACALYFKEWLVDILPTRPHIVVGGGNSWFETVLATAEAIEIEGQRLWRASAWAFIATKLEAWSNRGRTQHDAPDFYHQDMEDIIAVLDGRMELQTEARNLSKGLRAFLLSTFTRLLLTQDFIHALAGHVAGCESRAAMVLQRLESISAEWERR